MSLHHIAARLRYAAKDWQTFLDQKYEGGKKKVRNPNPDTRDIYPEVSLTTAMSDDNFATHIEGEYKQWKGSQPKPKTKPKNIGKSLIGSLNIDAMISEHKDDIDKAYAQSLKDNSSMDILDIVYTHHSMTVNKDLIVKTMSDLSDKDKFLLNGVQDLGKVFESRMASKPGNTSEKYFDLHDAWKEDSSEPEECKQIHAWLSKLHVRGSFESDYENTVVSNTKIGKDFKSILSEGYAYQQAVFKHLGITHVTLYRGVRDDQLATVPPSHGDKVQIESRPASSWSASPKTAQSFGPRMIKSKVPVERILMSPISYSQFGGANSESEYVVIGAEDLEGEVFGEEVNHEY